MARFTLLISALALMMAMTSTSEAAVIERDSASTVNCTPLGVSDEVYFKQTLHSDPLFGVKINKKTNKLIATKERDTNEKFQFLRCDAPSTGYIQGQPIKAGSAGVYFGHLQHISTGKCLQHDKKSLDFNLADCPTRDTAKTQLPFWFETVDGSVTRFTGYKNTTAYPQPDWFAIPPKERPFNIKTQGKGPNGKSNQYAFVQPIRT